MLYPKNIEQKLGFDKIRALLHQYCISPLGAFYVDKIRFSDDARLIEKLIRQSAEFQQILRQEGTFPAQNYIDLRSALQKAAPERAFLSEEEFFELRLSLQTIADCLLFLHSRPAELYPYLRELSSSISLDTALLQSIQQVIDERGRVRDNASEALRQIRRRLAATEGELKKKTEQILKSAKAQGFTDEKAGITVRSGRVVIPLAATHKRKIKGFIHDESDTGQTVYLEPAEILDINNEIKELENEERREIVRILTALTDQLRPHLPQLSKAYYFLGMMDFIRAKALLAEEMEATAPLFVAQPMLQWKKAKHPLLLLANKAQGKKVVPLDLELHEKQRILVISGPNAGGKSIALKTVGLLQYMFQCGLLVPMQDYSQMGLFKHIFIDIGDEQSLENDLSTYSSHLTNMRQFVNYAQEESLFLIDEFGTGTEPRLGGAVAEAVLEALYEKGAYGVVNTHYGNLKLFAQNKKGIANAAMRFDVENLEPLYSLEIGQAGSSFAFEIAQKIGLPKKILAKAKEKLGDKEVNFDKVLRELEQEKKLLTEQNTRLRVQMLENERLMQEYQAKNEQLSKEKKAILDTAKLEAKQLLKEANQKIEETIKGIKEQQAEKSATKQIRQSLESFEEKLQVENLPLPEEESEEIVILEGEIKVGDWVRIKGQNTLGEVLELRSKEVEILIGDLKSIIKLNRLEKISRKVAKKERQAAVKRIGMNINEKAANFSFQLDLRGRRGEEALQEVDSFIDNAILVGFPELRIVHGKGDGILRKLIREKLREYAQVASFADEHADRGGAGVTIVKMK
jgi:DNA mismatch repair protein MutS2